MKADDINLKIVETMIMGSLKEFVRKKDYFRISTVGLDYCYPTDEGEQALTAMLRQHLVLLHAALEKQTEDTAKQHMMDTLKK